MTKRKRANKSQFRIASAHKKRGRIKVGKELKQYLTIIDDLHGKLFNPAKYPDISKTDQDVLTDIACQSGFEGYEKSKLWGLVDDPDCQKLIPKDTLESLNKRIAISYHTWVGWITYSDYFDRYQELVESLHPATQKLLPQIVPEYQSPEQIRVFRDLEAAYSPEHYSQYGTMDFSEFRELEWGQYQKLAKERRSYFLKLADQYAQFADLIREHAPITNEKKWPPQWMLDHKGIMNNLNQKKLFIPILQYITDHAFLRTEDTTKEFGYYHRENGREYRHIVTYINKSKIAGELDVSPDTIKRYIGAMKKAGFIKSLTNPYYAIGYWGNPHWNRIFFLKKTPENKEKLINFSIR